MPPKAKFTKEEIVKAALKIVEREGNEALTARSLGAELGSSARPVFTVFNGMDEVFDAVISAAKAVYSGYVEEGLKARPAFKGVGTAYIRFAAERPRLFRLLFMTENAQSSDKNSILQGIEEHYESILRSIEDGYGLAGKDATDIYMHLWIYAHGIAVLIATGVCLFTPEQISQMLTEVFIGILKNIKARTEND